MSPSMVLWPLFRSGRTRYDGRLQMHWLMVSCLVIGGSLGGCGGGDDDPTCNSPDNAVINGTCHHVTVMNPSQGVDTMGNLAEIFRIGLQVENFALGLSSYNGQVSSFPEFTPGMFSFPDHVTIDGGTIGSLSFLDV